MRIQKFSRLLVILLAAVVVILTTMVVANATRTITTPNAAFVSFSLAAGANSAVITPATSRSVLVMGCCTTTGGVGQASLQHIPSAKIIWVGLESYSPAAITQGSDTIAGRHIVYIEANHAVDIQLASADTIRVHNGSTLTRAGNVTLVW
jgi:hypothetical protein